MIIGTIDISLEFTIYPTGDRAHIINILNFVPDHKAFVASGCLVLFKVLTDINECGDLIDELMEEDDVLDEIAETLRGCADESGECTHTRTLRHTLTKDVDTWVGPGEYDSKWALL